MLQDFSGTTPGANTQHPGLLRLFCAINKINGAYYFCARKMKLKENTLALLYALDDGLPHSQKQVCEDWFIPKTTINTVTRELVEQGYVTLVSTGRHREKNIILTGEGRRYAAKVMEEMKAAEHEAFSETLEQFSPEFIDVFDSFARTLCRRLEEHGLK